MERVDEAIATILGEPPWSAAAVETAQFTSFSALDRAMRVHPGHAVEQALADVRAAGRLLREEVADFLAIAVRLGHLIPRAESHLPAGRAMLEREEWDAKKGLHRAAVAASTLVDMSRVMRRQMERVGEAITDEYAAELARLVDREQHEFVVELRNVASHARLLKPSWQLRSDASGTSVSVRLNAREYVDISRWRKGAIAYAAKHDEVDLAVLLASYEKSAAEFNRWLIRRVEAARLPALENYRLCDAARRRVSVRSLYKMLIQVADQRHVDPYAALPNFLSDDEIVRVNALPRGSERQIDMIIALADKHDAVDDDLRRRIKAIFASHLARQAG